MLVWWCNDKLKNYKQVLCQITLQYTGYVFGSYTHLYDSYMPQNGLRVQVAFIIKKKIYENDFSTKENV